MDRGNPLNPYAGMRELYQAFKKATENPIQKGTDAVVDHAMENQGIDVGNGITMDPTAVGGMGMGMIGSTAVSRRMGTEMDRAMKGMISESRTGRELNMGQELRSPDILHMKDRGDAVSKVRQTPQHETNSLGSGIDMTAYNAPDDTVVKKFRNSARGNELRLGNATDRAAKEIHLSNLGIAPDTHAVLTNDNMYLVQPKMTLDRDIPLTNEQGLLDTTKKDDFQLKAKEFKHSLDRDVVGNDLHEGNIGMDPKTGRMKLIDAGFGAPAIRLGDIPAIHNKVIAPPSRDANFMDALNRGLDKSGAVARRAARSNQWDLIRENLKKDGANLGQIDEAHHAMVREGENPVKLRPLTEAEEKVQKEFRERMAKGQAEHDELMNRPLPQVPASEGPMTFEERKQEIERRMRIEQSVKRKLEKVEF